MRKFFRQSLIVSLMAAMTACQGANIPQTNIPQIFPTEDWMQHPVRVVARFNGIVEIRDGTKTLKGYQFSIIAPSELKDKQILFESRWSPRVFSLLVVGDKYLVTVPRFEIGTNDLICDWALTYKEDKPISANQAMERTAK